MKKILIGLFVLSTTLFSQIEGVFSNFFKYSTIYSGFNLSSPIYQEDRYRLSMVDEDGKEVIQVSGKRVPDTNNNRTTDVDPVNLINTYFSGLKNTKPK